MSTNGEKGVSAATAGSSPNMLAQHHIATAILLAACTPRPSRITMSTRSSKTCTLCNRPLYFHITLGPAHPPSNLCLPQGREDFLCRARGGTRDPQCGRHLVQGCLHGRTALRIG